MKRWNKEENDYLIKNSSMKTIEEMSIELNRTIRSVRGQLGRIGISLREIKNIEYVEWSKEEDDYLTKNYYKMTVKEISKKLNRTEYATRSRKNKLKLNNKYDLIDKNGGKVYIRNMKGYELYYNKIENSLRANHRIIFEKEKNIKLKKKNIIHHIDGDKKNNEIDNLLFCENSSIHRLVHSQLEKISYQLIKEGFILFDKENKVYIANSNRRLIQD